MGKIYPKKGNNVMANVTLEQFEALYKAAPAGTSRKRLARLLGVTLPVDSISKQLEAAALVTHTAEVSKSNPTPKQKVYVSIPNLLLDGGDSARGFWVNADVAREIFARGLEICDQNNL